MKAIKGSHRQKDTSYNDGTYGIFVHILDQQFSSKRRIILTCHPAYYYNWPDTHCCLKFGAYVQTHEAYGNNMSLRTIVAICLGPCGTI
jgi:hypothetical protein